MLVIHTRNRMPLLCPYSGQLWAHISDPRVRYAFSGDAPTDRRRSPEQSQDKRRRTGRDVAACSGASEARRRRVYRRHA